MVVGEPVVIWATGWLTQQRAQPDRQASYPRDAPHCATNGAHRAKDRTLAHVLYTRRVITPIVPTDQNSLQQRQVRVHRGVMLAKARIHHPARPAIRHSMLMQRKAQISDHAAELLALPQPCIEYAPGRERSPFPGPSAPANPVTNPAADPGASNAATWRVPLIVSAICTAATAVVVGPR